MNESLPALNVDRVPVYHPHSGAPVETAPRARADTAAPPAHRNAPLTRLCDALDAIFEACAHFPEPSDSSFFARSMRIALAEAAAEPALLTAEQRAGSTENYRRHLLAADPHGRYAIAALVWQPQQASPVHGHHTWCGYAVLNSNGIARGIALARRARRRARVARCRSCAAAGAVFINWEIALTRPRCHCIFMACRARRSRPT
jgi:hypothetical protein